MFQFRTPISHNINMKHQEKITKYLELQKQIGQLWKMQRMEIVPLVISSMGVIPIYLAQQLEKIGLSKNIYHFIKSMKSLWFLTPPAVSSGLFLEGYMFIIIITSHYIIISYMPCVMCYGPTNYRTYKRVQKNIQTRYVWHDLTAEERAVLHGYPWTTFKRRSNNTLKKTTYSLLILNDY